MAERSLLFGLGVARSGSTWLHSALRGHPQVHLRAVKEAHWFDTLEYARTDKHVAKLQARHDHIAQRDPADERLPALSGLISALERGASDLDYLAWLQTGAQQRALVLGDMTPAYALLPESRLRQMQGLGLPARFLIVLRDPMARLVSHVQLVAARHARQAERRVTAATAALRAFVAGQNPALEARCDYAGIFARLDSAVAPQNMMVLFFERLFLTETLNKLTDWLGLSRFTPKLAERTNASVAMPLQEELLSRAHMRLAPQYEFARARFGADLPAAWRAPQARGLT